MVLGVCDERNGEQNCLLLVKVGLRMLLILYNSRREYVSMGLKVGGATHLCVCELYSLQIKRQ